MNGRAITAIFNFRNGAVLAHALAESLAAPVVSTVLYFVVFGAAIGTRIQSVEDVSYGAFIVPSLIILTVLQQSLANASNAIFMRKFVGTIHEILAAPISFIEVVAGSSARRP